jgi:hypothetical protein
MAKNQKAPAQPALVYGKFAKTGMARKSTTRSTRRRYPLSLARKVRIRTKARDLVAPQPQSKRVRSNAVAPGEVHVHQFDADSLRQFLQLNSGISVDPLHLCLSLADIQADNRNWRAMHGSKRIGLGKLRELNAQEWPVGTIFQVQVQVMGENGPHGGLPKSAISPKRQRPRKADSYKNTEGRRFEFRDAGLFYFIEM